MSIAFAKHNSSITPSCFLCEHVTAHSHLDSGSNHFAESYVGQCFHFLCILTEFKSTRAHYSQSQGNATVTGQSTDLERDEESCSMSASTYQRVISCNLHKPCFSCQQHPLFPKSPPPPPRGTSVSLGYCILLIITPAQ